MKLRHLVRPGLVMLTLGLFGCTNTEEFTEDRDGAPVGLGTEEDDFASANATLLDFEFDGEAVAASGDNLASKARAQLLFTVGLFNEVNGGPRLNAVTLSNLSAAPLGGGLFRIRYRAKLPVAWNTANKVPTVYTMILPKRVDPVGQAQFLSNWGQTCTDADGHTVTPTNVWYHYRPNHDGCVPMATDFTVTKAKVTKSPLNSSSKYPEYHRVWEDGVLNVVAVFGKYDAGATSSSDAGVAAYEAFVETMRAMLPDAATTPASLPPGAGVGYPDVTFEAEVEAGRVAVTTLLVDEVASSSVEFDRRFAELSPGADLIF